MCTAMSLAAGSRLLVLPPTSLPRQHLSATPATGMPIAKRREVVGENVFFFSLMQLPLIKESLSDGGGGGERLRGGVGMAWHDGTGKDPKARAGGWGKG